MKNWKQTGKDPWGITILRGGDKTKIHDLSEQYPLTVHIDVDGATFIKRYTVEQAINKTVLYKRKWRRL